jgi:dihydrofolate synthase/folylpolyglutamate synthase
MDYSSTIEYLFSKLPYFTRDGKAAIKNDLNNTIALCQLLGHPERQFKCIHIAGTNGKGSCSNMLSAVMQMHGYKTGLYTSPHLVDFRERIRINGQMISEQAVIEFVEKIKDHIDRIKPSFFEITVAMCFDYFAQSNIDIAIIETGLGGRLDSTNVIDPLLSVITNIGLDHTDLLGHTLEEIALEKAGIIKHQTPVVIGETHIATQAVFENKSKALNAPIYFADQNPLFYNTEIELDLEGDYQQKNVVTVLQTLELLKQLNYPINDFTTAKALLQVKQLTQFKGRWEKLNSKPLTIADTAHNAHGLEWVVKQIHQQSYEQLHMVIGMVKDKDQDAVLSLLPKQAKYYFCQPNLMRALEADALLLKAIDHGLNGLAYPSVKAALQAAEENAKDQDMIFIGGSTFVVAEVLA